MLTAFLTSLEQMTRILMFLVAGFLLNRLHILAKNVVAGISRLVTVLFLPALMLYSNMTEFNLKDVASYGRIVLLGAFFWGLITLLSYPVARKMSGGNVEEQSVYLYGLSFPNTGAVGLPLMLAFFGTAGLFRFNLFLLVITTMTYAWGVGLFMDKEKKRSLRQFFAHMINPVFIAIVIGFILGALGAKNWMPEMVSGFASDLADCYVPISLLSVGYSIAEYPLGEIVKAPKGYLFTTLRLVVIPVFALVLAWLMGLSQAMATMIVLAFASPCGMNAVVYPAAYGRDCKVGTNIVVLSSLGSILTVPLLYALTQYFFH